MERLGKEVEQIVRQVPGTLSVYGERVMGGNYLDFRIDRNALAVYGLQVGDVQEVIQSAIGGMNITTTVEGLERYPINLRYSRELRHNLPALSATLVSAPNGRTVPLGQLGKFRYVSGPSGIKSENGKPNAWVYVDVRNVDIGGYVAQARQRVNQAVQVPPGYTIDWSGQFESMQRARRRLMLVVPLTLVLIFVMIYINTRSLVGNRNGSAGSSPGLDGSHLAALPVGLPAERGPSGWGSSRLPGSMRRRPWFCCFI